MKLSAAATAALLFAAPALAQESALVVTCGDCSAFQGIEELVDGTSVNVGNIQGSVRAEVSSGSHEVRVFKWNSPFSRDELANEVITFPKGTELRIKATPGKL